MESSTSYKVFDGYKTILLPLEVILYVDNVRHLSQVVVLLMVHQKQVLLFGQSAGAISSFALATLPEIRSLANAVG